MSEEQTKNLAFTRHLAMVTKREIAPRKGRGGPLASKTWREEGIGRRSARKPDGSVYGWTQLGPALVSTTTWRKSQKGVDAMAITNEGQKRCRKRRNAGRRAIHEDNSSERRNVDHENWPHDKVEVGASNTGKVRRQRVTVGDPMGRKSSQG